MYFSLFTIKLLKASREGGGCQWLWGRVWGWSLSPRERWCAECVTCKPHRDVTTFSWQCSQHLHFPVGNLRPIVAKWLAWADTGRTKIHPLVCLATPICLVIVRNQASCQEDASVPLGCHHQGHKALGEWRSVHGHQGRPEVLLHWPGPGEGTSGSPSRRPH